MEPRSIVGKPDWPLNVFHGRQLRLEQQFKEEGTVLTGFKFLWLVVQHIDKVERLEESHYSHALRTTGRVELLDKVKSTSPAVAKELSQQVLFRVEIGSKVLKKVGFCSLQIIGLDTVDALGELSEADEVVYLRLDDVRVFEVV